MLVADKSHTNLGNGLVLKAQIAEDYRKRAMPSSDTDDGFRQLDKDGNVVKIN